MLIAIIVARLPGDRADARECKGLEAVSLLHGAGKLTEATFPSEFAQTYRNTTKLTTAVRVTRR